MTYLIGRMQIALETSTEMPPVSQDQGTCTFGFPGIETESQYTFHTGVHMGTKVENLGLSCCYSRHQPRSSPTLSSFTLKMSPSDLTYGTCEERIKFPQPLSTSYDYSSFLIVKLVIFCSMDQNSSPSTSSNIFSPCYMD